MFLIFIIQNNIYDMFCKSFQSEQQILFIDLRKYNTFREHALNTVIIQRNTSTYIKSKHTKDLSHELQIH